jgi:uncharacterized membrane protein required for colicin V production
MDSLLNLLVLAVLLGSTALGFYQGSVKATLGIASYFLSFLSAWIFYPLMAANINAAGKVIPSIIYYSESSRMLDSVDMMRLNVGGYSAAQTQDLLAQLNLPHPVGTLLAKNIISHAFAAQGLSSLNDYLNMTIAHMTVNLLSFLAIFLCVQVALSLVVYLCDTVFPFPVMQQLDGVLGALLGFIRGGLFLFVIFSLTPIMLSFLPFDELQLMVSESALASFFYNGNYIIDLIRGFIPG